MRTASSCPGHLQDVASILNVFGMHSGGHFDDFRWILGAILIDFQRFRLSLLVFVHVGTASLRQLLAVKTLTSRGQYRLHIT